MDISIIIPTCNRENIFIETLESALKASENMNAEIIIINDSKSQKVNNPFQNRNIVIIDNPLSGAASARNLGARNAKSHLFLFLDDDIIITEHNIRTALEFNKKHPLTCLNLNWAFPQSIQKDLKTTQFGRFLISTNLIDYKGWVYHPTWDDHKLFEVKKLAAFFLLIPRKIFEMTGGFDESFKNQGVEDDELCRRIENAGFKMHIDPLNTVLHNEKDKLSLKIRLKRLQTGAYNKRHALEMGMREYEIHYSYFKILSYSILSKIKNVLIAFANFIPNIIVLDPLYQKTAHLLVGIVIFDGYYRKKQA